jgi:hypothetical protein
MSKVLVTLDYEELEYCAISGARRNIRAMQKDRKPRQSTVAYEKQHWWQSHVTGVIGEYAVAKSLGEHWLDLENDRGGFDVLSYQVRSTEHTSPKLAARPNDDLNHIYILAQVYKSRVLIHGWATGYEIQQLGAQEHGTIRLHHDMLNDMSLLPHPTIYTAQVTEWERPDYQ